MRVVIPLAVTGRGTSALIRVLNPVTTAPAVAPAGAVKVKSLAVIPAGVILTVYTIAVAPGGVIVPVST